MRIFFWIFLFLIVALFGSKIFTLLISGKFLEAEEWKKSFRDVGKNLWWGMKTFVVLWLLYLIFIWWVRHR